MRGNISSNIRVYGYIYIIIDPGQILDRYVDMYDKYSLA